MVVSPEISTPSAALRMVSGMRNVRVTPLPGFGDLHPIDYLRERPETFVFSSDYPHHEGNADPINLYGPELATLDEPLRTSFLGANIEECFARTGDPLPAPALPNVRLRPRE